MPLTQSNKPPHLKFGAWAETKAADFLVTQGYQILSRNLKIGRSELDLVALDISADELVIVEVKARQTLSHGHPSENIRGKKWLNLQRTAYFVLKTWNFSKSLRFDIISLSPNGLEHFKNVTWP